MTQLTFAEINPASDLCQRWRAGTHSWRHRSEGGFDSARYSVEAIDEVTAKRYVTEHHYSGSYPAASRRYGLFVDDDSADPLVGVAVFSIPVQRLVLSSVFPDLEPMVESLELGRFVLEGDPAGSTVGSGRAPGNAESWFLARAFAELASSGVRGVVSFADPVPRRIRGRLVFPGHVGTIYQASGSRYLGRGAPSTLVVLPDGRVLNNRSMSKVRQQERGHDAVERRLVELGATAPRAGQRPSEWLRTALEDVGAQRFRHRGCHRYGFAIGTTRSERRAVRIALDPLPYVKRPDAEAA